MPIQRITNDDQLDDACNQLDRLRRDIARGVIQCQRDGRNAENDEQLSALRDDAAALLAEISRFEMLGNNDTV